MEFTVKDIVKMELRIFTRTLKKTYRSKPYYKVLGYSATEYKNLLKNPTPEFYKRVTREIVKIRKEQYNITYLEFKEEYDAVPFSHYH